MADADPKIVLYENVNFGGEMRGLTSDDPNLTSLGFNDKVSSIAVVGSVWVAYEHADYKGLQYVLPPGTYPNWEAWKGVNDQISSVKKLEPSDQNQVTVYEHVNFEGKSRAYNAAVPYVGDDFNDIISSANVTQGTWVFYEHANFEGKQYVVPKGQYKSYKDWAGVNDQVSSLKPIPTV